MRVQGRDFTIEIKVLRIHENESIPCSCLIGQGPNLLFGTAAEDSSEPGTGNERPVVLGILAASRRLAAVKVGVFMVRKARR